jgi:LysR family transcriptional activator of dmlA
VVLPDYKLAPGDLFVFYPTRRNMPAKVRAFIDFLAEGFSVGAGTR